jgi:polyribonucleotide nucleotidyltransferase
MKSETLRIGDVDVTFETGRIASQADFSAVVRQQDTVVLTTICASNTLKTDIDFLPLTVEYRELFGAAGIIPHSYGKREGRQSDKEVLSSRIIDRSIRPLFPKKYRYETQVISTLLSCDPEVDGDSLGLLGATMALHLSGIPWDGPAAGLRIVKTGGRYFINPSPNVRQTADIDVTLSAAPTGLIMVEGHAREASESDVLEALTYGRDSLQPVFDLLARWRTEIGIEKWRLDATVALENPYLEHIKTFAGADLSEALNQTRKTERYDAIRIAKEKVSAHFTQTDEEHVHEYLEAFEELKHQEVRRRITENKRLDGRQLHEVRLISGETGWLPRPHGSALFTRGETQACVTCTLAPLEDSLKVETTQGDIEMPFFLHYSFPPYSVGEVKAMRGPGRREIGHGNLAWRALLPVLPSPEEFPYAVRIYSEITESNGSSSMASVCGGCLSLMDAGVPIARPVAGVAMGLISENGRIFILTDIIGDEDHLGDMDFKVAGTQDGITAIQMDNKIGNLSSEILQQALEQARIARRYILGKMKEICPESRPELKPHAPHVLQMSVRPERIREIIGPAGKIIQEIQKSTQSKISVSDSGAIRIYAADRNAAQAASNWIKSIVREPEIDHYYRSRVVSVKPFGLFVELFPGTEGLVHISELNGVDEREIARTYPVGASVPVKVIGVDERGRLKLSCRQALGVSEELFESG